MTDHRSQPAACKWLFATLVIAAIGFSLSAGAPRHGSREAEAWTSLVQTGDDLAAGQSGATPGGQSLTARQAYLLAFHEAQDAGDLEHALAVADRLEATGELDLAAHVRRAAEVLLDELSR